MIKVAELFWLPTCLDNDRLLHSIRFRSPCALPQINSGGGTLLLLSSGAEIPSYATADLVHKSNIFFVRVILLYFSCF